MLHATWRFFSLLHNNFVSTSNIEIVRVSTRFNCIQFTLKLNGSGNNNIQFKSSNVENRVLHAFNTNSTKKLKWHCSFCEKKILLRHSILILESFFILHAVKRKFMMDGEGLIKSEGSLNVCMNFEDSIYVLFTEIFSLDVSYTFIWEW